MMDEIGTILLAIIGLLELGFSIYLFTRYEKAASITFFGLFSLCVSGWVLANSFGIFPSTPLLDSIGLLSFVFAAFIFPTLYLFVLHFPYKTIDNNWRLYSFVFLPSAILSALVLFSHNLVQGFEKESFGQTIYGQDFWIYLAVLFVFFFLIIFEIAGKAARLEGLRHWQIKMLFYAILVSGIFGLTHTLIFPYIFRIRIAYWFGPAASIIWLGMMVWVIRRKA